MELCGISSSTVEAPNLFVEPASLIHYELEYQEK